MDIERVNIVFKYDMPEDSNTYLHRVARAGRFGTKGLAVSFVSSDEDASILNKVQERFDVQIRTASCQKNWTCLLTCQKTNRQNDDDDDSCQLLQTLVQETRLFVFTIYCHCSKVIRLNFIVGLNNT